ncbi:YadA family autotransporter adhesin [Stenoxybacter acetivorans]|uniref:YadA family autotransporter adhesin n=1 Tax=Stenoxybacter acetivorans TaxID=422441 RepID=UPI00055C82B3|nr:YadA-like family protein [Stenoxybacter acetivorans]
MRLPCLDTQVTTNSGSITQIQTDVTNIDNRVTANETTLINHEQDITNLYAGLNDGSLGLVRYDAANGKITVAAAEAGTRVDFSGTGGSRILTGVAAGAVAQNSTEAVNGGQLWQTEQNLQSQISNISSGNTQAVADLGSNVDALGSSTAANLGGGSSYDAATGAVSAPNYAVQGTNHANVGDALTALDTQVTANSGDITQIQTDVTNIDNRVTANETTLINHEQNITNLYTGLNDGSLGLVRYDAANGRITVAAAEAGTRVDFSGTSGSRVLVGVAAGSIAQNSTEAVNGSQLWQTEQNLQSQINNVSSGNTQAVADLSSNVDALGSSTAANLGGGSSYDAATGAVSAPNYAVQGTNHANVGDALTALDTQVTANETTLNQVQNTINNLNNGTAGLVQQDANTGEISVAANTGGTTVNFAGTQGDRVLAGVADGAVTQNSTEAVNGSQLWQTEQNLINQISNSTAANAQAVAKIEAKADSLGQDTAAALGGGAAYDTTSGKLTAPNYSVQGSSHNNVGDALTALDTQVTANSGDIAQIKTDVTNIDQRVTVNEADISNIKTNVSHIDNRLTQTETTVARHETDITNINERLNNTGIGLVTQDSTSREIKVAAQQDGTVVNVAGTQGDRRITGVADGQAANDAVNRGQLDALASHTQQTMQTLDNKINANRKHASRGIAAAMAMTIEYPQQQPGQWAAGMGLGQYDSETALAVGVNYLNKTGKVKVYGGFGQSLSSDSRPAAKIGFGFVF